MVDEKRTGNFVELIDDNEEFPLHIGDSTIWLKRIPGQTEERIIKKHTKRGTTNWTAVIFDIIATVVLRWEKVPLGGNFVEWDRSLSRRIPADTRELIMEEVGANVPGTSVYEKKSEAAENLPPTSDSNTPTEE